MHGSLPRLATSPTHALAADLTARARIRNAALDLFTEHGADRVGLRDVARLARVSAGLVQHHFGTKDGLRAACDDYALGEITRIKEQVLEGEVDNPAFLADIQPELLRLYRYVARSMIDGSPGATALFDQAVAGTQQWLIENVPDISDFHAFAALMVAMEIGLLAMHRQLSQALGADVRSPEGNLLLTRVKSEFYSTPLLSKKFARQARSSIDAVLDGYHVAERRKNQRNRTRRQRRERVHDER